MARYNDPPLLCAVWNKDIVECRRLIDTGEANVNGDRNFWNTALHYASTLGCLEIAELLTSSGADVNITNFNGETALHIAAGSIYSHLEIVQLLLCQGADISIISNGARTALDYASSRGHLEVADCLRKWPWTMAIIIVLKENLAIYHLLDASTIIDLWQYLEG